MSREEWRATALTAAIVAGMVALVIALNRASLAITYRGGGLMRIVVWATFLADGLLLAVVRALLRDLLRARGAGGMPRLLPGLLALYVVLLWLLLAPTIAYLGRLWGLEILIQGWAEPENQLVRTAITIGFVALSYQLFVGRYRGAGPIARWRARRRATREG